MHEGYLKEIVQAALVEDQASHDITTNHLLSVSVQGKAHLLFKSPGVVCGLNIAEMVFKALSPKVQFKRLVKEGAWVKKGTVVATLKGPAGRILSGERVAINFLMHCSAIATRTRQFVEAVKPYQSKVLDTRKTTPLLRELERYAVRTGGGVNHRFDLAEMAMIKDNHRLMIEGKDSLKQAVEIIKAKTHKKVVLEVDNFKELAEALTSRADVILLDNMTPAQVAAAVRLRNTTNPRILLEASGGIHLKNIKAYAKAGVERISVGSLTSSKQALDISLDFSL